MQMASKSPVAIDSLLCDHRHSAPTNSRVLKRQLLKEGLQMPSSGSDVRGRAMAAPAIISHERRPTTDKGIREATARSKADAFDVQSFLNFATGARRMVDFKKNEI